jgi:hypothetical protein
VIRTADEVDPDDVAQPATRQRTSRGYTPCDIEMLRDRQLSGDGLRLLLLIRRHADSEESDGWIDSQDLDGLAVSMGIRLPRLARIRDELLRLSYLERGVLGFRDVRFGEWCKLHTDRAAERDRWRKNKRTARSHTEGEYE